MLKNRPILLKKPPQKSKKTHLKAKSQKRNLVERLEHYLAVDWRGEFDESFV
ncbi:MAG: hypothetical protein HPY74_08045 [Firmicutes bacterium]|nr:hypothetical protein [Bacillota bacterium]